MLRSNRGESSGASPSQIPNVEEGQDPNPFCLFPHPVYPVHPVMLVYSFNPVPVFLICVHPRSFAASFLLLGALGVLAVHFSFMGLPGRFLLFGVCVGPVTFESAATQYHIQRLPGRRCERSGRP